MVVYASDGLVDVEYNFRERTVAGKGLMCPECSTKAGVLAKDYTSVVRVPVDPNKATRQAFAKDWARK
eukprot:gene17426-7968_t